MRPSSSSANWLFGTRAPWTPEKEVYLEALTQFVGDYEDRHLRNEMTRMEPVDALKYLMAANDMKPADLGRLLGNRSLASQVLLGKRGRARPTSACCRSDSTWIQVYFLRSHQEKP